jgi:hypothetical protein
MTGVLYPMGTKRRVGRFGFLKLYLPPLGRQWRSSFYVNRDGTQTSLP